MPNKIKRPKRKLIPKSFGIPDEISVDIGYNCACEEWEKFLPDEEELRSIIDPYHTESETQFLIATAISKRIRGEK